MTIFLPDYSFGNRMCVVARDENVFSELMLRGVDTMRITDKLIVFYPGEQPYSIENVRSDRMELLHDYDIVEISEPGLLYRAFANNEADTTVFLGASCNSNCIMCPAGDAERKKGFTYSRELLMKYIDYLPDDLEHIVITGGEPTMQPSVFLETLERLRVKFPYTQFLLLTNGRSLSDLGLFLQVLEHKPRYFRIAIPIHGSTAELHDAITRASGSFAQTMLGLTRLMDSDIKIELRIVVTKLNCEDLLNIAKMITDRFKRVQCVNFIGLEPRGNCALNYEQVFIDYRSSFIKSKPAIEHLVSCGYDVGLYNYPLCAVDRDYWPIAAKSISGYKNVYHSDCDRCDVKPICGGFFTFAMGLVKPKVYPISAREVANE